MTPERWRQLEGLYDAVKDLSPAERSVRLRDADPELWSLRFPSRAEFFILTNRVYGLPQPSRTMRDRDWLASPWLRMVSALRS